MSINSAFSCSLVPWLGLCLNACALLTQHCAVCASGFVVTARFSLYRVLLRVRMLYYLKQEVIGSQAQQVLDGADSR